MCALVPPLFRGVVFLATQCFAIILIFGVLRLLSPLPPLSLVPLSLIPLLLAPLTVALPALGLPVFAPSVCLSISDALVSVLFISPNPGHNLSAARIPYSLSFFLESNRQLIRDAKAGSYFC